MQFNSKSATIVALTALALNALLSVLFHIAPQTDPTDPSIDLLMKMRGARELDPRIITIRITDEDLDAFGGWPIRRSYYGALIDALDELGARAVGIDVYFGQPNPNRPEDDQLLASALHTTANVCLSAFFFRTGVVDTVDVPLYIHNYFPSIGEKTDHFRTGAGFQTPYLDFLLASAGIGHANFGRKREFRVAPLVIQWQGNLIPSLALELYRIYLGVPKGGLTFSSDHVHMTGTSIDVPTAAGGAHRIFYNGTIPKERNITLLDFLDTFDAYKLGAKPSIDLSIFKDRIVLIGLVDRQKSAVVSSPFEAAYPALAVHAEILDDLLQGECIEVAGVTYEALFTVLVLALLIFVLGEGTTRRLLISVPVVAVIIIGAWVGLFFTFAWVIPVVRPLATLFLGGMAALYLRIQEDQVQITFRALERIDEEAGEEQTVAEETFEPATSSEEIFVDQVYPEEALAREPMTVVHSAEPVLLSPVTEEDEEYAGPEIRISIEQQLGSALPGQFWMADMASLDYLRRLKQDASLGTQALSDVRPVGDGSTPEVEVRKVEGAIFVENSPLADTFDQLSDLAGSESPVMIHAEPGTPVEPIVRLLHNRSARAASKLHMIDCLRATNGRAFLAELNGRQLESGEAESLEVILKGLHGGTLFLRNAQAMTPEAQRKLMRYLGADGNGGGEDQETTQLPVRIVSSVEGPIEPGKPMGSLDDDSYFRLNVLEVVVPPLRERVCDVPPIVGAMLEARSMHLSEAALDALTSYRWPGNQAELEALVVRATTVARAAGRTLIQLRDFPDSLRGGRLLVSDTASEVLESLQLRGFTDMAFTTTAQQLMGGREERVKGVVEGLCFQHLAESNYDVDLTAASLVGRSSREVEERARDMLVEYLLQFSELIDHERDHAINRRRLMRIYQRVPTRFHPYLDQVLAKYLSQGEPAAD